MFSFLRVAHFFFMSHFFLWLLFNDVTTLMTEEMSSSFQSHSSRDHPSSWAVARKCRSTGQICQGRFSWFFFHSFRFFLSEFELNLTRFRKAVDQNATRKKKWNYTNWVMISFRFISFSVLPYNPPKHPIHFFFSLSLRLPQLSPISGCILYIYIYFFLNCALVVPSPGTTLCPSTSPLSSSFFCTPLFTQKGRKKESTMKMLFQKKKKIKWTIIKRETEAKVVNLFYCVVGVAEGEKEKRIDSKLGESSGCADAYQLFLRMGMGKRNMKMRGGMCALHAYQVYGVI